MPSENSEFETRPDQPTPVNDITVVQNDEIAECQTGNLPAEAGKKYASDKPLFRPTRTTPTPDRNNDEI